MSRRVVTPGNFLLVVDNFYDDPLAVRNAADALDYWTPPGLDGERSRQAWYPAGTRERLQALLGRPIVRWRDSTLSGHGCFYRAYGSGKRREVPTVHFDEPLDYVTCLVYLTIGLPVECGTSLWAHRRSGVTYLPTAREARAHRIDAGQLRELIVHDERIPSRWTETDRVGYRFNRLVCYPSRRLHSATAHHGATVDDVRVYQTFRVGLGDLP